MPPYTMYIYGIMVSTLASDADDPGSNPGRVHYFFLVVPSIFFQKTAKNYPPKKLILMSIFTPSRPEGF